MKVTGSGPAVSGSTGGVRGTGGSNGAQKIDGNKAVENYSKSAPNTESSEKVNISQRAKDTAKATQIAKAAPDVNEEKIAKLKAQIAAGTYNVDADAIADRLVDDHLSF